MLYLVTTGLGKLEVLLVERGEREVLYLWTVLFAKVM
jgi:hypothetical protein